LVFFILGFFSDILALLPSHDGSGITPGDVGAGPTNVKVG
jgi:hypothetical protein